MEIPKFDKIVVNMGLGSSKDNPKAVKAAAEEMATITGQKPVITKAKNQSLTLNYVKACQSAAKLHYVARKCSNSWIAS